MDALVLDPPKKKHKKKNVKKKQNKTSSEKISKQNTKAFTFSGGRRSVHRRFQHASEVEEKRLRRPRVYKVPEVPPPLVVVVQGPKNVGKSTMITSLVKQYSKRNITNINGPITLVSSKSRRITLIECGNSILDMIDCCKIADIAILMVDGSYGYEMETLEFVNMMQVHGFPRVIGVLTHLDSFKDNKTMRKTKKILKKRFWSELYDGAKMFYFTGIQHDRYKKNEVLNLARYISSQKPPSINWRLSHPYTLSLRHEVIENKDDLCKVYFYGYVYGGKLNTTNGIHIPGAGDFTINSVTNIHDPCEIQSKDRTLKDKNRNIYAPYCDVGSVMLDDDAMYIQMFKTKEHFTEMPNEDTSQVSEAVRMVRTLQKIDDSKPNQSELTVLNGYTVDDGFESEGSLNNYDSHYEKEKLSTNGDDDSDYDCSYSSEDESNTEDDMSEASDFPNLDEIKIYDEISQRVYFGETGIENLNLKDFSKVSNKDLDENWDTEKLRLLRESKFLNLADNSDQENPEDEQEQFENDPESEKFKKIQEEEQKKLYQEALDLDQTGNVGKFVKICVTEIPLDFLQNVNPKSRPLILGSLQHSEQGCGFIQLKIKRHRWSPKLLKTNDPLLFSVGWRRFQSIPIYCMEDRNQTRVKMLKYTPSHSYCLANIYGPLSPPNFGVLAVKNWDRISNYRISATGTVVGTDQNYKIVKKLNLEGEAYKIMKNTCFIKNMFNSELEVIKCIGSKIQTTSGIRGQIKKPIEKSGAFRATFEDKILLSDIVLLKSWVNVETKRFYNLILDSQGFRRVKSLSELKKEELIKPDSKYQRKDLLRRPIRRFNEIKIPKKIIEKLSFSSKPKVIEHLKDDITITVDPSEHEKRIARTLQKLHTVRKDRLEKRLESIKQYKIKRGLDEGKLQEARKTKLKEIKRAKYAKQTKKEKIKRSKLLLD